MRGFEANNCRLCEKVFCCKKCRLKHETNFHKVLPECDICIYGKFVFENLGETYLHHLQATHLPLNCNYCKRVFFSIEEILHHKKCAVLHFKEDSPKTPTAVLVSTDDQDSPILQELQRKEALNYIFNLATSTPMPRGQEPNMFDKSKGPITPVDANSQVTTNNFNKSIIKKTDSLKSEHSSKRRVTFGDTTEVNKTGNKIFDDKKESTKDTEFSDQKLCVTYLTPVTGMITGQFYSAKSEIEQFSSAKSEVSSKVSRENNSEVPVPEGYTPVCIPNLSKMNTAKGHIYKTEDYETTSLSENKSNVVTFEEKSVNSNLDEVSMEICTPARNVVHGNKEASNFVARASEVSSDNISADNNSDNISTFSGHHCTPARNSVHENKASDFDGDTNEGSSDNNSSKKISNNISKLSNHLYCTPANPGKITVKGDIYSKQTCKQHVSSAAEPTQEKEDDSSDKENDPNTTEAQNADATAGKTLWSSALNLEDSSDSNKYLDSEEQSNKQVSSPKSPPKSSRPRVSIVMPTPILRRTNYKMKFQIPAHFSSTPIMSSGAVKIEQTKMVQEISTRVIQHQTPFKTPQGKFSDLAKDSIMKSNFRANLETLSDVEAGSSNALKNYTSETKPGRCIATNNFNMKCPGSPSSPVASISVSSMTESTLWTSVTRIVKSVLGGFTNTTDDSNFFGATTSVKRQLSDPDSAGDFLEAPRLKRFKFTDIKCRRPIRNLPALEAPPRLPAATGQIATFEIVKSVSTLYGAPQTRIQYNKATQTDDYLMYGWHPKI